MFCSNCGTELIRNARFCNSCGTEVAQLPESKSSPNPSVIRKFTTGEITLPMTEELRSQVYDDLMSTVLPAIENGLFPLIEAKKSAQYMLDHLDGASTYYSLIVFLMDISYRWSIYKPVFEKHFDPQKLTDSQKMSLVAENMSNKLAADIEQMPEQERQDFLRELKGKSHKG